MSNFIEVQLYNGGPKVTLNLDMAESIVPSNHKDAKAIIWYPGTLDEASQYHVTESYEYLSRIAIEGKTP